MIRKNFAIAIFAGVASAFERCSTWNDMPNSILSIDLDSFDLDAVDRVEKNGFELSRGGYLTFVVSGNPTTGFEWDATQAATNGMFEVCGEYVADEAPEHYAGVGGTYYFTIKAGDSVGDGSFDIAYDREWDELAPYWGYSIPIHVV